ncbi:MAG: DUF3089 domain-containing protein [Pseudomonadota bacterium]
MVRKFLYIVATLIALVIVFLLGYRLFGEQLIRGAMVPTTEFEAPHGQNIDAYADAKMWIARPDIKNNPALWLPPDAWQPFAGENAAIFFIHPTSYLNRAAWNAPLDDTEANERASLFVRGQASTFSAAGEIWAPRYAQATFGAFLTDKPEGQRAIAAAYADVLAAFDSFIANIDPKRPVILAGHSQGALHLTRLLKERVAGQPIAKRVVAAYVVGWPVSIEADLPAIGLPACADPETTGCILSWQSFAEPADPSAIREAFDKTIGLTGLPRKETKILCTNPINGTPDAAAPASANRGTTKPSADMKTAEMIKGAVPARCAKDGVLLIGDPPKMGPYTLPGNNYHVYDYSLFWTNIRADAVRRTAAFSGR